jgi:hypothetical protein
VVGGIVRSLISKFVAHASAYAKRLGGNAPSGGRSDG